MKKLNLEMKIIIGIVSLFLVIGGMFLVTNNKGEFSELKTELAVYEFDVENKFIVTNNDIKELKEELENQKKVYNEKLAKYNQIIDTEKLKTDKKERNVVEEVKYKEEIINNFFTEKYKKLDFKKRTFKDGNEDEMVALGKINSELEKLAEANFDDLEIEQKQELLSNYQKQIKEYEKLKEKVENRIASEKAKVEAERIAKEQATPSGASPLSGANNSTASANTSSNTYNNTNNANTNNVNTSNNNSNNPVPPPKTEEKTYFCAYIGEAGRLQARADGEASGRGWQVAPCGDGSWQLTLFDGCNGLDENGNYVGCPGILPEWS